MPLTSKRTSSKAHTVWAMSALQNHVPKILIRELRGCRYYTASSDSIQIDCDAQRNRTENKNETHRRLQEMIKKLYQASVPGVTTPEQQSKVAKL